ncbi:sigma-70 family RNA polymerase sigma factor [Gemmata massiliana]|nr:sigma-70 family RNA polymerase sigma factor [Gemmata massiliana]
MADPNPARAVRQIRSVLGTDPGESDARLLARFADHGDEAAFGHLVARHAALVQRVCFSALRDHHAAEDASQAAFLVLARKAGRLRGSDTVAGWLFRVARRIAVKSATRRTKLAPQELPEDVPAEAPPTGADADLARVVHDEIARLPERYRVPVIACLIEGRTHAEAASWLGWPIGTVAGRLARAKEQLERQLGRRGVSAGAALTAALVPNAGAAVSPTFVAATVAAARAFAARAAVTAVSHEVLTLSNRELKSMSTMRWLTIANLLAGGVLLGAVAVAATRNGAPDAPPAPPAATPSDKPPADRAAPKAADLIIGRWQGEGQTATTYNAKKDPDSAKKFVETVVIEFRKDGTVKVEGTGIPELKKPAWKETGKYKFRSDTEVEMAMEPEERRPITAINKIEVTRDELTITELEVIHVTPDEQTQHEKFGDKGRKSTYKRTKEGGPAVTVQPADVKIDPKKLVGKWGPKKKGEEPFTIEFTQDGKVIFVLLDGKETRTEGTYKMDGNKLTRVMKLGQKEWATDLWISKLTDTEMTCTDERGRQEDVLVRLKDK